MGVSTRGDELVELSVRTRYFLRMISDLELLRLNNLVASGLASGISPELAMQPLQHEIERNPVRAMDIEFDAGCSESPVESHLLLHPASPLSRHLRSAYAGISGSGTYYNGMFGHGQSLLDAVRYSSAVDDIEQPDRPPAPISEQVLLCVRLLGMSNVSLMPEAASAVRRHLSGIMLDYPVLLHHNSGAQSPQQWVADRILITGERIGLRTTR